VLPRAPLTEGRVRGRGLIAITKSFFRYGKPYNSPCPPLKKGGNYKELLLKSPFGQGELKNLRTEETCGKRHISPEPGYAYKIYSKTRKSMVILGVGA
jgi:hypothetical protein